ncbi:diacylglycerol/lipid kinase family protein [Hyphococcus sp.]|uniref:diacylglycerol/lipid kinase family protein n=1 Tax=Hyphococcus sp. TaxID=2038636 RepID=UPI003D146453
MCVRVFINTHSGGVRAVGAEKISSLIFHELKGANLDCEISTGGPPECSDFFETAKNADDTTMVIVAGGDGTIAFAAKELAHTNIPVALLPGGTMNLIAHDLRVGGDIERAIEHLTEWRPRLIDIAMVNDRAFLNNIVFGDYADIAESREAIRDAHSLEERLGAISEAAQTLMHSEPKKFEVTIDGETMHVRSNILMIANNPYTTAIDMRPRRKRLDTGRLAVYLADSKDGVDMVARIIEVLRGEIKSAGTIECRETVECTVKSQQSPALVAVDGEPLELENPVKVRILPRALSVLCPD